MIRVLIPLALLIGIIWFVSRARRLPPEQRRPFVIHYGLILLAALVITLALMGRIHWIGAAIAAFLPLARQLGPLLIPLIPGLAKKHTNRRGEQSGAPPPQKPGTMSREEALKVLGLSGKPSKDDIIAAHRSLMQKIHPDRGGNDFLAAQINTAKEVLLNQ